MAQRAKTTSLVEYSIHAMKEWLKAEFAKYSDQALSVAAVTGPSMLRQIPRLQAEDGQIKTSKLSYPYLLYSLGDLSLDTAKGGLNKRSYRNIVISKDTQTNMITMAHLRPIKLGIGISFNTSDFEAVLQFSNVLLLNAPAVSFYMDMKSQFIEPIGVRLNISESLTTPPVNIETPGEAFQFETVMTLDTYIGVEFEQRMIREVVFSVADVGLSNSNVFYNGPGLEESATNLILKKIAFTDYYDESNNLYKDR